MGDWDRMKTYISDYLENSLDPTTRKEFEQALNNSGELRLLTVKMKALKFSLNNLIQYKCSDDFSTKLREKINLKVEPVISRQQLLRYSFAASFIIVVVVFALNMTSQSDTPELDPAIRGQSDLQIKGSNPVSNPVSGTSESRLVKDGEVDIKTKPPQQAVIDSTRARQNPGSIKSDPNIKYVGQEK